MFVFEVPPFEGQEESHLILVDFFTYDYGMDMDSDGELKNVTFLRPFIFGSNATAEDVYLKIFKFIELFYDNYDFPEDCSEDPKKKMCFVNSKLDEGQFEIKILYDEGQTLIDFPYDDKRTIGNLVK
jgi:hypothetical protein